MLCRSKGCSKYLKEGQQALCETQHTAGAIGSRVEKHVAVQKHRGLDVPATEVVGRPQICAAASYMHLQEHEELGVPAV